MENKYNYRTDFAYERIKQNIANDTFQLVTKHYKGIETQIIDVQKEKNDLASKIGTYVSITFEHLNDMDLRDNVIHVMVDQLHQIMEKSCKDSAIERILIVGLGNSMVVADALGPQVCKKIMVTSHLFKQENVTLEEGMKSVSCLTPGVMGQTGIESSEIIQGVCDMVKPSMLIVIDALATKSMNRINRMIQISDTGIEPGSGVGNIRKAIDKETLGIPVIVVGVATVVDVMSIARHTVEVCYEYDNVRLREEKLNRILDELMEEDSMQLIVTPKQMDEELVHLSEVIATSINTALHENFAAM